MGKFLLILVASAVLVGVVTQQDLLFTAGDTSSKASQEIATVLAEQAAWGGLEEAAESVAGATAVPSAATQFAASDDVSGTRYRVTLTPDYAAGILTARSHGRAGPAGKTEGQSIMEVDFALRPPPGADYEPPAFMQGLIRSNRVVNDGGNMQVSAEDPAVNTDVYTNEYVNARGTGRIPGFLYHSGDMSASKLTANLRMFQPTDNPDGLASVQRIEPYTTPYFNPPDYLSKATKVTPTQLSLYGTIPLGTKENPEVWYIDGNLNVGSADVTLEGYGVFIVNGSMGVTNQFTVSDSSPSGNSVAFYVRDDIAINNSVDLAGQFFANGGISLSARSTITGSMTADQIQFGRTTQLIYRAPSPWQTDPIFGPSSGPMTLRPVAYRAWDPALETAGR